MKVDKSIRSGVKKADDYIESLENYLLNLEASNIYALVNAIDEFSGIIKDDILLLASEKDPEQVETELRILGSKKNKHYETFLSTMKQLKDFKVAYDIKKEFRLTEALKVDNKKTKTEEDTEVKKKFFNIQDIGLKTG